MVKAAYSCGKPALGVGAGNVPAYIERTAKLQRAVNDVVLSKAFDNGMVCASEQAVILDEPIYDAAMAEFAKLHAYRATAEEKALLEQFMFGVAARRRDCSGAKLNAAVVGQSPAWIAEQAGFAVPEDTSIILAEVDVGRPARAADPGEALPGAGRAARRRRRPTASRSPSRWSSSTVSATAPPSTPRTSAVVEEFGTRVKAVRIICELPHARWAASATSTTRSCPSLTLGCGSLRPQLGVRQRLRGQPDQHQAVGRRNNNLQWFKVPARPTSSRTPSATWSTCPTCAG